MSKTIYIKEQISAEGRKMTAYSTLTYLLRSENMIKMYRAAWLVLREGNSLVYNNLLIHKIQLHHDKQTRRNSDGNRND